MTQHYPAPVAGVAPSSAASRCGLAAGDVLLAINGMPVRDTIDVRVYSGEPELEMVFDRGGDRHTCTILRQYGEPLGLQFSRDLFCGEPRRCRNRCAFCFVAQMPPDLRPSLYVRDDDYRLSFLHGNYITLTNLSQDDWARIEAQYLSPLYISVHATEPKIRADLLRNPRAGQILRDLRRLAESGIEMHTQAVLVPGENDGAHLNRTIEDLVALYPAVRDLSVVPVGLTRWHAPALRTYSDAESEVVLDQVLRWQARLRDELGNNFVYPSDEWFLRAGREVPPAEAYDGLLSAMIENGVGMVRRFWDHRDALRAAVRDLGARQTWVTGTLFAPHLLDFAHAVSCDAVHIEVVPVPNRFFGETVTVAGLLTVEDMLRALAGRDLGDAVVLPLEAFRGPDGQALDGARPDVIQGELACKVYLIGWDDPHGWSVRSVANPATSLD
jgi:putative radical SAM enzyme (TIGR03279 family)